MIFLRVNNDYTLRYFDAVLRQLEYMAVCLLSEHNTIQSQTWSYESSPEDFHTKVNNSTQLFTMNTALSSSCILL